jgi:hypothetical protein
MGENTFVTVHGGFGFEAEQVIPFGSADTLKRELQRRLLEFNLQVVPLCFLGIQLHGPIWFDCASWRQTAEINCGLVPPQRPTKLAPAVSNAGI